MYVYKVTRMVLEKALSKVSVMFHWLVGWYCSCLAAPPILCQNKTFSTSIRAALHILRMRCLLHQAVEHGAVVNAPYNVGWGMGICLWSEEGGKEGQYSFVVAYFLTYRESPLAVASSPELLIRIGPRRRRRRMFSWDYPSDTFTQNGKYPQNKFICITDFMEIICAHFLVVPRFKFRAVPFACQDSDAVTVYTQ